MDDEWALWRIVRDAHIPLSELDKWSLDDIRKFNSILDMGNSYETAIRGMERKEMDAQRAKSER